MSGPTWSPPRQDRPEAGPEWLERYVQATALRPPADLVLRIGERIAREPISTAPRRFLAALRILDLRGLLRATAQSVSTAFGPGTRSVVLRMQAMAVVLVAVLGISIPTAAGLAGARFVVAELSQKTTHEDAVIVPHPSPSPTPVPALPEVAPKVKASVGPRAGERRDRAAPASTRRNQGVGDMTAKPPKRPRDGDIEREPRREEGEREEDAEDRSGGSADPDDDERDAGSDDDDERDPGSDDDERDAGSDES